MTNSDFDFETWFDTLAINVLDRCGVEYRDMESVRADYEAGRDVYDVIDEIAAEYGEAL